MNGLPSNLLGLNSAPLEAFHIQTIYGLFSKGSSLAIKKLKIYIGITENRDNTSKSVTNLIPVLLFQTTDVDYNFNRTRGGHIFVYRVIGVFGEERWGTDRNKVSHYRSTVLVMIILWSDRILQRFAK